MRFTELRDTLDVMRASWVSMWEQRRTMVLISRPAFADTGITGSSRQVPRRERHERLRSTLRGRQQGRPSLSE